MHKHLIVIVVFFATFSPSEIIGQANLTSATPRGEALIEANGSSTANKTEDRSKSQDVSRQARAEAKRLYKLGVKYGRSGLFRQASELFQKAVELNPNYADAHYGLGLALFDQGRWEEAIRSLENAIKINPKDKEARAKLEEASLAASWSTKPDLRSD